MTQKRSVGPWASEVICGPILLPWAEANPPDATRAAPFRHTILVRFVRLLLLLRRCRPRLASPASRRSRQRRRQPAGVCCVLRILARRELGSSKVGCFLLECREEHRGILQFRMRPIC
ncbi:hypothetical protein DAI22_08g070650 [Oryza sativa Japonica Group]|nr:hypothetical protein DAI22_08g070650 [Oryza sativa Japonica Group]